MDDLGLQPPPQFGRQHVVDREPETGLQYHELTAGLMPAIAKGVSFEKHVALFFDGVRGGVVDVTVGRRYQVSPFVPYDVRFLEQNV